MGGDGELPSSKTEYQRLVEETGGPLEIDGFKNVTLAGDGFYNEPIPIPAARVVEKREGAFRERDLGVTRDDRFVSGATTLIPRQPAEVGVPTKRR